jgi:hypothetical protein
LNIALNIALNIVLRLQGVSLCNCRKAAGSLTALDAGMAARARRF